jgi:hypothetical protein
MALEVVPTLPRPSHLITAKQAWLELSVLSLKYSHSSKRPFAPSRAIECNALRALAAAGHIKKSNAPLRERRSTASAAMLTCAEAWSVLCAQIECRLHTQRPNQLQLESYETIWRLLAAADIEQYATSLASNGLLAPLLARQLMVDLRKMKTPVSIEQQRLVFWLAAQHKDASTASTNAKIEEIAAEMLYMVATEYRFSRAYAPPSNRRLSCVEVIFNSRLAQLGRTYFDAPVSLRSLQEARRS